MQDLLSLSDEVLKEVHLVGGLGRFDRVPFIFWMSLCEELTNFLTESRCGVWRWRRNYMKDIILKRFSNTELLIFHQYAGLYFSNNIPEVIRQKRLISTQPFVLNSDSSLWNPNAIINQRRCRESVLHLIHGEFFYEASKELCSFDYINACIVSRIFTHIDLDMQKLGIKILDRSVLAICNYHELKFSNESLTRFNFDAYSVTYTSCDAIGEYATLYHFYQWLRESLDSIGKNLLLFKSSLSRQPDCSIAKSNATEYFSSISISTEHTGKDKTSFPVLKPIQFGGSLYSSLKVDDAESMTSVVFCGDGSKFVADGDDSTIRIWHVATGECLQTLDNFTSARMLDCSSVTSLVCNFDCSTVIAGLSNSSIKVWNYPSGICVHTLLEHSDFVSCLAMSDDGTKFVSGSSDCCVKEWDVIHGTCLQTLVAHSYPVTSVCFSPDGRRIASGSEDRTIIVWDFKGTKWYRVLKGHTYLISSVCFSTDGKYVLSGSWDKSIKIWDSVSGTCVKTLSGHMDYVTSIHCNSNSKCIISSSCDSTIKLWDFKSGDIITTLEGHNENVSTATIITRDFTEHVLSATWNKSVKVWDLSTGFCIQTLDRDPTTNIYTSTLSCTVQHLDLFEPSIIRVEESKSEEEDNSGELDFKKGEISYILEKEWLKGHSGWVTCVCESPNGLIASGSVDNTIRIWDVAKDECITCFEGHYKSITVVKFDSKGGLLLSGSCDSSIKLWDMYTRECIETFDNSNCNIISVDFSSDGAFILSSSSDFSVQIWDIKEAMCIQRFIIHSSTIISVRNPSSFPQRHNYASETNFGRIQSRQHKEELCKSIILVYYSKTPPAIFSSELDSILLDKVSYSGVRPLIISQLNDHSLKLWDLLSEVCLLSLEGHGESVTSVCMSVDESWLVTGSEDKMVKLWDMKSHACSMTFEGHKDDVKSVSLNGDASRICSGSNDSTIRVWDARTGSCIHILTGHTDWIKAVHFSFDGSRIITGADDKTVRVWDARSGQCIKVLEGASSTF